MQNSPIPILSIDPDRLKKEEENNFWRNSLATVAGGVGGLGVGTLIVNPYEYVQSRKAEKNTQAMHETFMQNREVLETLRDLHTGKLTWDDIEPEAKPYLEEQYQLHQDLLNNRQALREALSEAPPTQLHFFPGAEKFSIKRLLPSADLFKNFRETAKHPVVATSALMGGGIAGFLMDRHNQDRFYDILRTEQEKQQVGGAILGKEEEK